MENVQLTAKELEKMGGVLVDILNRLRLVNVSIECLEVISRNDKESFFYISKDFLDKAHDMNEDIVKELDRTALKLLNNADAKELEAAKL